MKTDSPETSPRGRTLVTFSRSWQALAAVRSLGSKGIEIVTGDEFSLTPGGLSKYSIDSFVYPNPDADPEGFLDALEDAVRGFRPHDGEPYVLLPVHRETYLIARHRQRFEPHIALALPDSQLIEQVRDKGRLVEIARSLDIPTPRTWLPESPGDLGKVAADITYPAFVKVRKGVAGVGLERVEDETELRSAFDALVEDLPRDDGLPIIQEAALGDDYCVSALLDHGEVRAVMTYRNLRSIVDGAPGAIRQTVEATEPEAAAVRLLEELQWHGIAQVDFLWTGRSEDPPILIEINPRLFGGLFHSIASGVDYPWMLYQLALGREVRPPEHLDLELLSETPVFGLLATLREAAENAAHWETIGAAWRDAKKLVADGSLGEALETLWSGLKEGLPPDKRQKALERLLQEREASISQLFAGDDPQAALGLLYPLAIFLKQGKITSGMAVGAEPVHEGQSESR